jgi:RNA polymerase sigma factor (sigma-70 family)
MGESVTVGLRNFLVCRYDELKRRLTLHFGNADIAADALQDTWLRLDDSKADGEPVKHPLSYLLRMATNVALDRMRSEKRFLSGSEVDQVLLELTDPMPTPEQTLLGFEQIHYLAGLIGDLPARQRNILMMVRIDHMQRQEVAERLGISLSLVDRELKRAHDHLTEKMKEAV